MKLSKAQLQYISQERTRMSQRLKDLETFGDDIYKSAEFSADRRRIYYDQWFYNHMLKLHKIEVESEETMSKEDYEDIYGWGGQG
jgi:hypothetical protein